MRRNNKTTRLLFLLSFFTVFLPTFRHSLTLGVVTEYGLFRLHDSHLEILELAGVIGGLISLFGDAHTLIGKAMIALLHFQREALIVRQER